MPKNFWMFLFGICSLGTVLPTTIQAKDIATIATQKDIAEEWPAHLLFLLMFNAQDRIVETSTQTSYVPWLVHSYPNITTSIRFGNSSPNPENLVAEGVKLVFFPSGQEGEAKSWSKLGLATYSMPVHNYLQLLDCIQKTSEALGDQSAIEKFKLYRDRWDKAITEIRKQKRRNMIPPKVLHITSLQPLLIDGEKTLVDEWITMAGARNAAKGAVGNKKPADWEQISAWNPDVIILQSNAGKISDLKSLTGQAILKSHKVIRNPSGLFLWDRYGPDSVMQIQWATDLIQEGKVDEQKWIPKIISFYKEIYGLTVSKGDALRMLEGKAPN